MNAIDKNIKFVNADAKVDEATTKPFAKSRWVAKQCRAYRGFRFPRKSI